MTRREIRVWETYSLVIDDGDLFHVSIPAKFVVQVPLGAADAETEDT